VVSREQQALPLGVAFPAISGMSVARWGPSWPEWPSARPGEAHLDLCKLSCARPKMSKPERASTRAGKIYSPRLGALCDRFGLWPGFAFVRIYGFVAPVSDAVRFARRPRLPFFSVWKFGRRASALRANRSSVVFKLGPSCRQRAREDARENQGEPLSRSGARKPR
jgi:hypothetical protein